LTTPARRGEGSDKDTTGAELQRTIGNTVKYMDSRFKNLFEKPLSCFKVFDPSSLPLSREELANYGDEKVDYLVKHFASLLNEEEKGENSTGMDGSKNVAFRAPGVKQDSLYKDLLTENPDHLSHILLLVKLMLTNPSTAIC